MKRSQEPTREGRAAGRHAAWRPAVIRSSSDIYSLIYVSGTLVPGKSTLKSRRREHGVYRTLVGAVPLGWGCFEAVMCSDASEHILDEEIQENQKKPFTLVKGACSRFCNCHLKTFLSTAILSFLPSQGGKFCKKKLQRTGSSSLPGYSRGTREWLHIQEPHHAGLFFFFGVGAAHPANSHMGLEMRCPPWPGGCSLTFYWWYFKSQSISGFFILCWLIEHWSLTVWTGVRTKSRHLELLFGECYFLHCFCVYNRTWAVSYPLGYTHYMCHFQMDTTIILLVFIPKRHLKARWLFEKTVHLNVIS